MRTQTCTEGWPREARGRGPRRGLRLSCWLPGLWQQKRMWPKRPDCGSSVWPPCWLTHTQHTPLASVQGQAGSPACTQPRVAPGPALLLDAFLTHRECLGLWVLAPHGGREPKHDVARPGFHQEREHRKTLPSKLWNFSGYFIVIKEKEKKQ